MLSLPRFIRSIALLGLLAGAAGASHASLMFYSTQASFTAATAGTSVDTFSGLGSVGSLTHVNRSIGDDSYRIWAPTAPGNTGKTNLLIAQSTANPAVGVYYYGVPMVIDNFSSTDTPVQAIGGNFFNIGGSSTYVAGMVTLTALDSDGASLTQTIRTTYSGGLVTSFEGFVTTATLVSLTLTPAQGGYAAAVDNLTLGSARAAATVPEPGTAASLAAAFGAALIAGGSRRRRAGPARLLA